MLKIKFHVVFQVYLGLAVMFSACSEAEKLSSPIISFTIPAEGFKVEVGKSLSLNPTVVNGEKSSFTWEVNGQVVSSAKLYTFIPSKIGSYNLKLQVSNEIGSDNKTILVSAFSNLSPFITKIFDYKYGPGQHSALIPADWKGDDFIGEPWTGTKRYTSLGGWGGYITAGFDHVIKNVESADFMIYTQPGPSSEPAVVFVMNDDDGDGTPDGGEWAEIKGSEYIHPETIHDYQVTYFKPVGSGNVTWKDNKGSKGELVPVFESSTWWWSGYGSKTEVTFNGVKLPNAYINSSTNPDIENWTVRTDLFTFGYAECYNNLDYNNKLKANLFDISNAVDKAGNKVNLAGIRFIKVQSGVFQVAGWLNEISTEVSGAADLSLVDYPQN